MVPPALLCHRASHLASSMTEEKKKKKSLTDGAGDCLLEGEKKVEKITANGRFSVSNGNLERDEIQHIIRYKYMKFYTNSLESRISYKMRCESESRDD